MGLVVFVDVVHRIFSRSPGRLATLLAGVLQHFGGDVTVAGLDATVAPGIILGVGFLTVYAALRTRAQASGRSLGRGALVLRAFVGTVLITVLVQGFVRLRPEGMVWAPYSALVTLLWVGLIGASMATYKGRHLALEMGEKLWPASLQPTIKRIALIVTAAFSLLIVLLGSISLADHFAAWRESPTSDLIPAVDWPKWVVFAVVPYAFAMIAIRLVGRALGLLPEPEPPEVPT
ncbi:MAG TPA: TRAP transporter small permease [Myxococcota bacterium]|nr:TRAP transporter small permease [Myxococcota bacterium]